MNGLDGDRLYAWTSVWRRRLLIWASRFIRSEHMPVNHSDPVVRSIPSGVR